MCDSIINRIVGFEHLHLHTDFSLLDGYGMVEEYAVRAPKIDQKFLCVTDHGMMGVIPRQIRAADENNLSPIFGCELYCQPMQQDTQVQSAADFQKDLSEEEKAIYRKSYHLLAIATNNTGYKNLVRLSSWGWVNGFYRKPRVNYDMLQKHKEGIIFTSCCYMSEIGQAFERGGKEAADEMIRKYMEMFQGQFYLEFMLLDFNKQKPYDIYIIDAAERFGLPLIVTNDTHYCEEEDSKMQRLMLMIQTKNTVQQIEEKIKNGEAQDLFELQDQNLWMKSEIELNRKWYSDYRDVIPHEIFERAKQNTVKICELARNVQLDRSIKLPQYPDADLRLMNLVQKGVKERDIPIRQEYLSRIKEEYELICRKGFSSYFLIQQEMTNEARRVAPQVLGWGDGSEAVGPGRGSAAGSLICYLLGITDVDPIREGLLFSRFLSPARGGKQLRLRFKTAIPTAGIDD